MEKAETQNNRKFCRGKQQLKQLGKQQTVHSSDLEITANSG
jgi:hypothetical protein